MKIVILAVGKVRDRRILSMAEDYLGRVQPQGIVSVEHVNDSALGSVRERVAREGREMLKKIRPRDRVTLLREDGPEHDSVAFSRFIAREVELAAGRVVFAIGGPWGVDDDVRNRADSGLALSKMTLTHEMCFLFLAEQLYRAFSILRGTGYHH